MRIPEPDASSAEVRPLSNDYVILEVERRYGQSILVVDVASRRITERIWGYRTSFSPDGTKIAYTYRFSPRVSLSDVVLGYDLEQAKSAVPPAWPPEPPSSSSNTPADRGTVLYPPENRASGKRFPSPAESEGAVQLASPMAWCGDQTKLAFLAQRHDRIYLVVLAVSGAFRHVGVLSEMPVDESLFVGGDPERRKPSPGVHVKAQSLRFTPDCNAVIAAAWPLDIFAAKEVLLEWR
jgi:hypothetical protein